MILRTLPVLVVLATPLAAQQFTTAAEVKPILMATQANWVSVRAFNGQDLLYFTHLEAWRCGLDQILYSINGGPPTEWPMEPCYEGTATPNAITAQDRLPYTVLPLGSVADVVVSLVFDDGTIEGAKFERAQILIP